MDSNQSQPVRVGAWRELSAHHVHLHSASKHKALGWPLTLVLYTSFVESTAVLCSPAHQPRSRPQQLLLERQAFAGQQHFYELVCTR
jgi:hypothetical protein